MSTEPWSKFYWADWRSEPKLRMCCLGARGLWMELLSLMHESDEHAHLLVNGKVPSDQQLAILCGASATEIRKLKAELEDAGVPGVRDDGVWFSRRMMKDRDKRNRDKANGSKGGNPQIVGSVKAGVNPPDNQPPPDDVNRGDKARGTRDLDARSQKPEKKEDPPHPPEFDSIWLAFPKQRKGNKQNAYVAYQKALTRSTYEEIYAGFTAYLGSDEVKRGFAKGAAAWFNDDRWKNDYTPKWIERGEVCKSGASFASEAERIAAGFLAQPAGQGTLDRGAGSGVRDAEAIREDGGEPGNPGQRVLVGAG